MTDKKSFVLFNDLKEPVNNLSDMDAGKLFKAIFEYQNGGMSQDLPASAEMAFLFIKQQLDRSTEWYESICERNRINGAKGGRPKNPEKPKEPSGLFGNPPKPKLTLPDPDPDPDPHPDPDKEEKKGVAYINAIYIEIAESLANLIDRNDPKHFKNKNKDKKIVAWADSIRLLIERDGRPKNEVEKIIEWCQDHHFWKTNILSGAKLRKQYPTLMLQMQKEKPPPPKKKIYPVCAACGESMQNPILNNVNECYGCGEKHEWKVLMMKMKEMNA